VEPTEEQFLVFNALDTLALILGDFYDERQGNWSLEQKKNFLNS
jgi:hypothetical protein